MRRIEKKPHIEAKFFGKVRFIDLLKDKARKEKDEIFFSIERRDSEGKFIRQGPYGYIRKTSEMETFIEHEFFTGCNGIEFIQWKDCFNVVFDEQSIIGGISFEMSLEEFLKLFPTVELLWKGDADVSD